MKIVYGTTNPAKLMSMRKRLEGLDIELVGLTDIGLTLDVDENGKIPAENAKIKALAYFRELKIPVFSADSGLYIDGLAEEEQPGVHVRRVQDKNLSDEEMISYYAGIATKMGGEALAHYEDALCFVIDENNIYEQVMNRGLMSESFIISNKPHLRRNPGFPIDSLSIEVATHEYYYDLEDSIKNTYEYVNKEKDQYRLFFINALNHYNSNKTK